MNSNIILTLNLEEDSILLNEGILTALDWPRQVQLLINPETKQLVLRACTVGDTQAVVIEADEAQQCEISGRSLLKKSATLSVGRINDRGCAGVNICRHTRRYALTWQTRKCWRWKNSNKGEQEDVNGPGTALQTFGTALYFKA